MPTEDAQIQVWATPADYRPPVVFGARSVGGERELLRWNFWRRDGEGPDTSCGSIHDALDNWSVGGEDSSWYDVRVVAAPASIAVRFLDQDRAAWPYEQFWWWCNSGTEKGQIGTPEALNSVARVDVIESFRRYLQNPLGWTMQLPAMQD